MTENLSSTELIHARMLVECEVARLAVLRRHLESLRRERTNLEEVYRKRKGLAWSVEEYYIP